MEDIKTAKAVREKRDGKPVPWVLRDALPMDQYRAFARAEVAAMSHLDARGEANLRRSRQTASRSNAHDVVFRGR